MSETPFKYELIQPDTGKLTTPLEGEGSLYLHEGHPSLKTPAEVDALKTAMGNATAHELVAESPSQEIGRLGILLTQHRRDRISQNDVELVA